MEKKKTFSHEAKIILLGTGTPNASPERSGPAIAIVIDKIPYIIDFGPGIIRRAVAAKIEITKICKVFLTHLHSDHTVGYPDLIFTPWVLGRNEPLEVYGPKGLKKMTKHILSAYQEDIKERLNGLEPANKKGFFVIAHEIKPGIIYQDKKIKVEAFPTNHGNWSTYGFKVCMPNKIVVISGDTAPMASLLEYYKGCDILIHEVYSAKALIKRPEEWQKYHKNVHTSSLELAEIASKIKPKLLVLYHQLFWDTTEEELVKEIQEKYNGTIVSGRDLDVF